MRMRIIGERSELSTAVLGNLGTRESAHAQAHAQAHW